MRWANKMKVKVRPEFSGSRRFRLEFFHDGTVFHEYVRAEEWTREAATDALDLLQYVYKLKRSNIRFEHY